MNTATDLATWPEELLALGLADGRSGRVTEVIAGDEALMSDAAAVMAELFDAPQLSHLEEMVQRIHGNAEHGLRQAMVVGDDHTYFFQRLRRDAALVVVSVHRATPNLGILVARTRTAIEAIEERP